MGAIPYKIPTANKILDILKLICDKTNFEVNEVGEAYTLSFLIDQILIVYNYTSKLQSTSKNRKITAAQKLQIHNLCKSYCWKYSRELEMMYIQRLINDCEKSYEQNILEFLPTRPELISRPINSHRSKIFNTVLLQLYYYLILYLLKGIKDYYQKKDSKLLYSSFKIKITHVKVIQAFYAYHHKYIRSQYDTFLQAFQGNKLNRRISINKEKNHYFIYFIKLLIKNHLLEYPPTDISHRPSNKHWVLLRNSFVCQNNEFTVNQTNRCKKPSLKVLQKLEKITSFK